jgi:protein-S-isoprenylcysteine O-methyltransferase Ste14
MWKMILLNILAGAVFLALVGACLFLSAGRWDLPFFWAYLGVNLPAILAGSIVADPTLTRERIRPGPGAKKEILIWVMIPLWVGMYIVAGLDVGRYHWSDSVPLVLQVVGLAAMAAGMAVMIWALAVNRFFSSVIRIQTDRGHHLITTGPYRYIRHPAYASCFFLFVGGGLALGSWLAVLLNVFMVAAILRRTALEDRFLRENLEGYADYARKVRYRLIPGVW